jgi:hypothetical protein
VRAAGQPHGAGRRLGGAFQRATMIRHGSRTEGTSII